MPFLNRSSLFCKVALAALPFTTLTASGAVFYWDPLLSGTSGGGTGTWDDNAANWSTAATGGTDTKWVQGNDAMLGGTAGTVTLETPITTGNLAISTAAYTVATGTNPLTITGGISASFATGALSFTGTGGVVMNGTQTVNVLGGINFNTPLSGSGTITKTGGGALGLVAANTYTGNFVVTAGLLGVNTDSSLGAVPSSLVANNITLNGGGLVAGTTFTGATNFANPGTVILGANRGISLGTNGGNFRVGYNTSVLQINGPISGVGNLNKIDNGILILAGDNTYQGATSLLGTLQVGAGAPPAASAPAQSPLARVRPTFWIIITRVASSSQTPSPLEAGRTSGCKRARYSPLTERSPAPGSSGNAETGLWS